ncbi:hypothetical protein [Micromonospora rubida]|uniref:hypothetical protein n=1 Tax=Micromonospora rubida TaxID=2697657 RepID=UPI001378E878|nr:hypothetical protein [Micromonospora rubida]NBE81315.1 hypothetical protein [Micromonospora rubida]
MSTRWPSRLVRLLAGRVGPGTLLFAVSIGPLAHHLIPKFTVPAPRRPPTTGTTPPCPA